MFKRVGLFFLTNLLVMITIWTVLSLLGVHGYLTKQGINFHALLIFCLVWGMGGAFISLLMSRWMAKKLMGVAVIDPATASGRSQWLVKTVHQLAHRAGLSVMPEVGIYQSPECNAFATGPTRRRALVAVSSGILDKMSEDELTAVLGHEISHVANGDMVTMMLIQGVVNAFAMFLSRIVAYAVAQFLSRNDEEGGGISYLTYYVCVFVFDIIFTILGSLLTAAFSRWREFRADAGGASLTSRDKMIAALRRLQSLSEQQPEDNRVKSMATLKISRHPKRRWLKAFSTHPPTELRIKRLQTRA